MREYRGRCIGDDDVYGWVEGYYVHLKDIWKKREVHRIYNGFAECDCGEFYEDYYEVDPETVGQFTGVLDKNGKKIFEGDILRFHGMSNYPVFWDADYCAFGSCYYSDFEILSHYNRNKIEIIGNIHDNPELLEQ